MVSSQIKLGGTGAAPPGTTYRNGGSLLGLIARVWPQEMRTSRRFTRAMRVARSRTPAKLYWCKTLLERLPQHLYDMAEELRELIQKAHAMVRQRHLARHRHMAATDQSHVREGVVRGLGNQVIIFPRTTEQRLAAGWMAGGNC